MDDLNTLQALAESADPTPADPDLDTGSPDEPAGGDGTAPPSQPALTAADVAEIRKRLDQADERNQTLEQRLRDTQSWANNQNQARILAEGLLQAKRTDENERRQAEAAAQQVAFPHLSPEQREQLVADPELLDQYIRANNEATVRYVMGTVQPQLAASQQVAAMLGPMIERQSVASRVEARSLAAAQYGISAADFDALVDQADRHINTASGGDWQRYHNMRMDPRAVAYAVLMERDARGQGSTPSSPRAPSLGAGDRRPAPTTRTPALQKSEKMRKIEAAFGISITPDDVARHNERRAAQGRR
jgi:hypothetical protein